MSTREIWQPGTPLLVRYEAHAYGVLDDGMVSRTPARLTPGEALTVVSDHGPIDTLVTWEGRLGQYFVPRMALRAAPDPQQVAAPWAQADLAERVAALEAEVTRLRALLAAAGFVDTDAG